MARQLLGGLALFLIGLGLAYFALVMVAGVREGRRRRRRCDIDLTESKNDWTHFVLVPALDEEVVIADTISALAATLGETEPDVRIVLVDDGSTDGTAAVVDALGLTNVEILRRREPIARKGKGAALNYAYGWVREQAVDRKLDPDRTLVWVMDADGRLSHRAGAIVSRLFDENDVGGVQLPVRIRARDSLLTQIQHLEFWTLSAVSQLGRARTDSVSLGGNGQVSRLSALLELGDCPWSDALTEDLDLALSMMTRGWRLTTSVNASVDQQGVDSLGRLLRQRTRWYHGTIQCSARVPEVWRSPYLSTGAALETCMYLLLPLVLVLPWSLVFHAVVYDTFMRVVHTRPFEIFGSRGLGMVTLLSIWYAMSFLPNLVLAVLHWSRDRTVGFGRAIVLAHAMIVYNYIAYAATWSAVIRVCKGQTGWSKTTRSVERPLAVP